MSHSTWLRNMRKHFSHIRNFQFCPILGVKQCFRSGSGLDPDSIGSLDPDLDPDWESGSGSGSRGKKSSKNKNLYFFYIELFYEPVWVFSHYFYCHFHVWRGVLWCKEIAWSVVKSYAAPQFKTTQTERVTVPGFLKIVFRLIGNEYHMLIVWEGILFSNVFKYSRYWFCSV